MPDLEDIAEELAEAETEMGTNWREIIQTSCTDEGLVKLHTRRQAEVLFPQTTRMEGTT